MNALFFRFPIFPAVFVVWLSLSPAFGQQHSDIDAGGGKGELHNRNELIGPVVRNWTIMFNGSGNGDDIVNDMAIDGEGNLVVTGYGFRIGHSNDYTTIKYDRRGKIRWVAYYDGTAGFDDRARALVVDEHGCIYITGESSGTGTGYDFVTVKYDPHGEQIWEARYNGTDNGYDCAVGIDVNIAGQVYVTGKSRSAGTKDDFVTVKYDRSGNEIWKVRYDGPSMDADRPRAIVVDGTGSTFVTGWSKGLDLLDDYTTIKYDPDGNEIWVNRYDGPAHGQDIVKCMTLDANGNIYLTGRSQGIETSMDYATVKYDTDGNELWHTRYSGPAGAWDGARFVVVDEEAFVYVTGRSAGENLYYDSDDFATVKYDPDGNTLWVARYNGPGDGHDSANWLALDRLGNIYVTGGSVGSDLSSDYATIKYTPQGTVSWVARFNGLRGDCDGAQAVAVDDAGKVFVSGESVGFGTGFDYVTLVYSDLTTMTNDPILRDIPGEDPSSDNPFLPPPSPEHDYSHDRHQ